MNTTPSPPGRAVALTGAGGLIGQALLAALPGWGFHPLPVRSAPPGKAPGDAVAWQPPSQSAPGHIESAKLRGVHAVVHLAGEPVAKGRWNAAKLRAIRESRVAGTRLIARAVAELDPRPAVFLCASGTGYYGDRGEQELTEDAGVGSGFLAEVARDWEAATLPAREAGIRTVMLRMGMVLSVRSGALAAMLPLFRIGAGMVPGRGDAWWPWVGLPDMLRIIHAALSDAALQGPINCVAPGCIRSGPFCRVLAGVADRDLLMRVPAWAVRAALGEKSSPILTSCRAVPEKLRLAGFRFTQPTLDGCLRDVLARGC